MILNNINIIYHFNCTHIYFFDQIISSTENKIKKLIVIQYKLQ